jgi:hypothetical protein
MTVARVLSKQLHDLSLTHSIFELLVLNEELLLHRLHSHDQPRVPMFHLKHPSECAFSDLLKDVEILKLRVIGFVSFE